MRLIVKQMPLADTTPVYLALQARSAAAVGLCEDLPAVTRWKLALVSLCKLTVRCLGLRSGYVVAIRKALMTMVKTTPIPFAT